MPEELPTNKDVLSYLSVLPQKISEQEHHILKTQEKVAEEEFRSNLIVNKISSDVLAKVEDGKPKFRNQQSRDAEIHVLLDDHKIHLELKESINKNKSFQKEQGVYLEFLKNRFSAAKYMARLMEKE